MYCILYNIHYILLIQSSYRSPDLTISISRQAMYKYLLHSVLFSVYCMYSVYCIIYSILCIRIYCWYSRAIDPHLPISRLLFYFIGADWFYFLPLFLFPPVPMSFFLALRLRKKVRKKIYNKNVDIKSKPSLMFYIFYELLKNLKKKRKLMQNATTKKSIT